MYRKENWAFSEGAKMKNKTTLPKTLAVIGTVLIWLPIVAPIVMAFIALAVRHQFLLDFLMPA